MKYIDIIKRRLYWMQIEWRCFYLPKSDGSHGPRRVKTCLRGGGGGANNKGADQPAHPLSAFVIRLLQSIISKIATNELLLF